MAMIDVLVANGVISAEELDEAKSKKINKLGKWYLIPSGGYDE